jgi:four helix bundle protein
MQFYEMATQKLDDLVVYQIAMEIGDVIWQVVSRWNYFERSTLGGQLIRAADSIALNIAEGYGRFHYKENKNFCYYSRGSAKETQCSIEKARRRNLIAQSEIDTVMEKLNSYFRLMHKYIESIGPNP